MKYSDDYASRVFLLLALCLSAGNATAGPFSLHQGMSQQELASRFPIKEAGGPGVFAAKNIPGGHPELEDYLFVIGEKRGLCRIIATTKTEQADAYGEAVKRAFGRWEEDLTAKYGAGEKTDFLRSGSLWNLPRDWMMGLYRNERYLEKEWSAAAAVDPELEGITLKAMAPSNSAYFITLRYDFKNSNGCATENRERNRSRL